MLVIRKKIYITLHRSTEIGHRPIPEQPGLDGAKGVQVEQLHRIGPLLPGEPPLRIIYYSVTFLSSAQDFFDVTLTSEESA